MRLSLIAVIILSGVVNFDSSEHYCLLARTEAMVSSLTCAAWWAERSRGRRCAARGAFGAVAGGGYRGETARRVTQVDWARYIARMALGGGAVAGGAKRERGAR